MTREIKFRGKSVDGQLVYGIPIKTHIGTYMVTEENPHVCSVYGYMEIDEFVKVDENTIGQFTGLHDKNGKEIYEGDIVYIRMNDGSDCHCVIGYDIDNLAFGIMDEYAYRSMLDGYKEDYDNEFMHRLYKDSRIFEVVGNIFDTPELVTKVRPKLFN